MAREGLKVIHVFGADMTDQVFSITLKTGEEVVWNVTKLREAANSGRFGAPRYAAVADLPPAVWDDWDASDRSTVEFIKTNRAILDEPAIAIASPNPDYAMLCFTDGQHRITARQELKLTEFSFYLVPIELERAFRIMVAL